MADLTVLVLGVGGNVSQGIQKALARAELSMRTLAGCVSPRSLGLFRADRSWITPEAADPAFIPWVSDLCRSEGVDAVLSGVEPVLAALAPHARQLREQTGAVCIVSPPETLRIGQDKLETCRWLERHGLPHPRFAAADDDAAVRGLATEAGFPLIAKPRAGKGGHGVVTLGSEAELEQVAGDPALVLQEQLGHDDAEYTAGCFCDSAGQIRGTLVMRRELAGGTTYRAEAGDFPQVREAAERIVSTLGPVGPCNVQSRLVDGAAVPFELNVRFSGTTPIRAAMGFNEVEAALRHFVFGEPVPELPRVTSGIALRYWNELYVPPAAVAELENGGRLDDPWSGDTKLESWGLVGPQN